MQHSVGNRLAARLRDCADTSMQPLMGCINAAMALIDAVFGGMTRTQWEHTLRSKVDLSWNLYQQLPPHIDFFILMWSLAGIYVNMAQANYAAGCAFQNALARHRITLGRGKTSVSLDLGWLGDAGIITERDGYAQNRSNARDMNPVKVADLIALLKMYCDPALPPPDREARGNKNHFLVGAIPPVDFPNSVGPHVSSRHYRCYPVSS